jgi:hypothetical protein
MLDRLRKTRGDLLQSADWNAILDELRRLDQSKLNNTTDNMRVSLSVETMLTVRGRLSINSQDQRARLHVMDQPSNPHGMPLVVGPIDGTHVRIGYDNAFGWIQTHNFRPLIINMLGNPVGVGLPDPMRSLHVHSDNWTNGNGSEILASGATAGYSFTNREPGLKFSDEPGRRWVIYSQDRVARIWSGGVDVLSMRPEGDLIVRRNIQWSRSMLRDDQGGSLELGGRDDIAGGGTPYIDFHFGNRVEDFNVRIVNNADRILSIQGSGIVNISAFDFNIGHASRRGSPGRALVDNTGELVVNFGNDWANTSIGGRAVLVGGNLGIGLGNPGARLTIRTGSTDPGGADDNKALFVTAPMGDGSAADGGVEFRHDNLTQGIGFGFNTIYATGSNANQGLRIRSRGTSALELNTHADSGPTVIGSNPIDIASKHLGWLNSVTNRAEIANDTDVYKVLMILGNRSKDGKTRTVGLWDRLEVNGELVVNSLPVGTGHESIRMIRGVINANGTIAQGTGFTVSKVGTGLYDISFSNGFPGLPSVVATQWYFGNGTGGDTRDNAVVVSVSNSSTRIKTGGGDGAASDRVFGFIVMGQR